MAETPLQACRARLRRAASIYPAFLIAASGGKDSNALFPLLAELRADFPNVVIGAYHYTLIRGLQCVERPIEILSKRYDVPVQFFPADLLCDLVFQGYCRNRTAAVSAAYAARVKMVDVEFAARVWLAARASGIAEQDLLPQEGEEEARASLKDLKVDPFKLWYVGGQRQRDSLERRAMLSSFRRQLQDRGGVRIGTGGELGLNPKERRVYPLAEWSSAEVLAFCRLHRLPPAADLGKANTKGVSPGNGPCMLAMSQNYPADFARLCERFPQARAVADAAAAAAAEERANKAASAG